MKKRILSILLAVMMIVPMFAMPMSVSAIASGEYSYKFEEKDARNAVAGQVIDVAATGECATAPTIDGKATAGEYTNSATFKLRTKVGSNTPEATIPVQIAVKGGYLYVYFEYADETRQKNIQYDIGVAQTHRSDTAWSRKQATWNSDNTTGDHSWLMTPHGKSNWLAWTNTMDTDVFLIEKAWDKGYEAKFDLRSYYQLFANSARGDGIYETPCVTLAIWYNVDNTVSSGALKYPDEPGQAHYAFPYGGNLTIDSEVTTTWVPATIIIPEESRALIAQDKRAISATVGGDYINSAANQMINNGRVYSDVLPVVDGTVNDNEYSAVMEYNGVDKATDKKMKMYYSVGRNGLVYLALTFKTDAAQQVLVQPGLVVNNGPMMQSRGGVTLKTDGTRANQNSLFKDASNGSGWINLWGGISDNYTRSDTSSAATYTEGVMTYEFTLSLPMLIFAVEEAGWSAYNAIGMFFYMWIGGTQYKLLPENGYTYASATETALKTKYGFNLNLGYWSPTLALPTDFYENFKVKDFYDAEDYFASGLNEDTLLRTEVAPSVVGLDGKISAGEYTAVQAWDKTTARASDSQLVPGINYDISGKNNFAYDDEYLYVGAEVYDPNFVDGETYFQFNVGALDLTDLPIDIGHTVRRMNFTVKYTGGETVVSTYGGILRSQQCNSTVKDDNGNAYIGQSAWIAGFSSKKAEAVASYDADTKTIVYEIKIKRADLEEAFEIEDLDRLQITTLAVYTNKETGAKDQYAWSFFKDTTSRVMNILNVQAGVDNGGNLTYSANMYGHVIYLNRDFATKDGASARISTENAGLRFKTVYTDAYLAEMKAYAEAKGETMEIGTLIAPANYITGEFTHAALGTGNYIEVMANVATPYANANGVTTIAGSIVNIKTANLTRDFAGIGFIRIGDEVFYSDTYTVRNVAEIATAALADTTATFTPGQILILKKLNGTAN